MSSAQQKGKRKRRARTKLSGVLEVLDKGADLRREVEEVAAATLSSAAKDVSTAGSAVRSLEAPAVRQRR